MIMADTELGLEIFDNTYQYYAHLQGFEGDLKEGDIVEPGQVIGYVGSTGYGKEGTSGKFHHIYILVYINMTDVANGPLILTHI